MKNSPIKVFLIDDEFPKPDALRKNGVFNTRIPTDILYKLAVDEEWNSNLLHLQQLIMDLVTSQSCKEGLVELAGFSSPTQALVAIDEGYIPDVVVYDWEYINAPAYRFESTEWLLEILNSTEAFVFVYSNLRDRLPKFLNSEEFAKLPNRFQLLMKGGKLRMSFSAEEFILQYIIGLAAKSGHIKINGVDIEFTSNNYLHSASDILYLQRILGKQVVLDELQNVNFSIDGASIEKILNNSGGYLMLNEEKELLIHPDESRIIEQAGPCIKISYLEVIRRYSIRTLESAIERRVLPIIKE